MDHQWDDVKRWAMRRLALSLTVLLLAAPLAAQELNTPESVRRVGLALERSPAQLASPTIVWPPPEVKRFGIFTLVPPTRARAKS